MNKKDILHDFKKLGELIKIALKEPNPAKKDKMLRRVIKGLNKLYKDLKISNNKNEKNK